ncbi:MAG: DNA gyrase subunit A [Archaeoglobaceae archaeon]|nr:DNA gyrase subunit A [Archaeoglobaceae archaeon]MDW8127786.1 DNA gyrase subunit A [Archaeoglobaceae archaeon]
MELTRDIAEELKSSYIDYAMSVIVGRALPDVRDGLKPVQRRILYAMFEMGLRSDKQFRKCARIVGEVLGKFHPHGDAAVYDALVRLAQDFTMRYALIEGQGNFGSIDGDSPAAMRYTEARLSKIAEEMLEDIEKETVEFVPNFDATLQEPIVLPSKIPNLLVNGSSGIAVGMATNIPPHNLSEVCSAMIYYIKNPQATLEELMQFIKGPDFPTGGQIVGIDGIVEAYRTGRGKIVIRGKAEIEEDRIIIREIPYMVNKSRLVESIAELAKEMEEIRTIRDESDREGIRIVVELKGDSNPENVLRKLYMSTNLETTFGITLLALVGKEPRVLSLIEMISEFVNHRREILRRKITYELKKANERLHIVEGLKKVIEDIDNAIAIIKSSKSPSEAKKSLIEKYGISEVQADAVLQTRLQKLTSLEVQSLLEEYSSLKKKIMEYESILAEPKKLDEILISELNEIKEKYGDARRTEIVSEVKELIIAEETLLLVTSEGFAKRMSPNAFKKQERGGVGVIGVQLKDDEVVFFNVCRSDEKLLLFTDKGNAFWLDLEEIPKMDRTANGVSLKKMIRLEDERIVSAINVRSFDEGEVLILSENAYIKRVPLKEFENAKRAGIRASSESIAFATPLKGKEVFMVTKEGYVLRVDADEIPVYSRNSRGVIAMRPRGEDRIAWITSGNDSNILLITENGYGKRCEISKFRKLHRGAKGVIGYKVTEKTGKLVLAELCEKGELFLISKDGYCIRMDLEEIPIQGRASSGVIVSRKGVWRGFIYKESLI